MQNKNDSEVISDEREIDSQNDVDGPELELQEGKKTDKKTIKKDNAKDGEKNPSKEKSKDDVPVGSKSFIAGLVMLFFACISMISIITFRASDSSMYTESTGSSSNFLGKLGSYLADFYIQFFGLNSFLIPIFLGIIGYELFKKRKFYFKFLKISMFLFLLCSMLVFWGNLNFRIKFGGGQIHSGGAIGVFLTDLSRYYLNMFGTFFISFFACLLFTILFFEIPFKTVLQYLKSAFKFIIASFKGEKEISENKENEPLANSKKKAQEQAGKTVVGAEKPVYLSEQLIPESDESKEPVDLNEIEELEPEMTALEELALAEQLDAKNHVVKKVKQQDRKFILPSLDLLQKPKREKAETDKSKLRDNARLLQEKLANLGVQGEVVAYKQGPVITMYEFKPAAGIKLSKISGLGDDLCMALAVESVRIVAPIPGKAVVGIELPNEKRETVYLREVFESEAFAQNRVLPLGIGKDTFGNPGVADLAKMPHLLVAGTTGSGKSVFIHDVICSLLYKFTPFELKLIMIDPKQLELAVYEDIPHLLLPVVNEPKKAAAALRGGVLEMEKRYTIMARSGCRNIENFNSKLDEVGNDEMAKILLTEKPGQVSIEGFFDRDENGKIIVEKMPYLVIIIDELADLMMVAAKEIEVSIARIAQKARAAGIHLMLATQRPSVDVLTGLIKANFPTRISFQVATKIDSRTVLDSSGAEALIGKGDLLFMPPGISKVQRMHAAFVSEAEVEEVTKFLREQMKPEYKNEFLAAAENEDNDNGSNSSGSQFDDKDEFYDQAVSIAREMGKISASMLQRRFRIGYNRAARLVETMEANGLLGPADGAKPREYIHGR